MGEIWLSFSPFAFTAMMLLLGLLRLVGPPVCSYFGQCLAVKASLLKSKEQEKNIMNSDWAGLPEHLLDSILERLLPLSDYLRFRSVCTSWRSVAKDNKSRRVEMLTLHQPPMLLIPTDKEGTWNLYNVVNDKILDLQLRLPNKRFVGSSKGWLITVETDLSVTLLNPFLMVEGREKKENSIIRLPQLTRPDNKLYLDCDWYVYKAMISADPLLNANDCIVVVIYEGSLQMAFLRVCKDTRWTYLDKTWDFMREVIPVEDKLYAIDAYHQLSTVITPPQSYPHVKLVADDLTDTLDHPEFVYLVSLSSKELMLVKRFLNEKFLTRQFKIFKWDFAKCDWIETKTLGNMALFVGDNSSVYVLTSSNCSGCRPNFIYFNHPNHRAGAEELENYEHDFGAYDIENQCVLRPYNTCATTLMEAAKLPPIWVTFNANSL